MANTTETTISNALKMAAKEELLIPAIQRDFVWSNDQICDLFDSAMRGYPIGTLLVGGCQAQRPRRPVGTFSSGHHPRGQALQWGRP